MKCRSAPLQKVPSGLSDRNNRREFAVPADGRENFIAIFVFWIEKYIVYLIKIIFKYEND